MSLALEVCGRTSPNPPVGAVVLDAAGRLVGEGATAPAGGPHAEVNALRVAGSRATDGTLLVTLEPCCHHGRTGPCTRAIVSAGIRRVVVAAIDPNPAVSGHGIQELLDAGLRVDLAPASSEVVGETRALLAPFAHFIRHRRPHVTAKYAMTMDGRIATPTGDSRWVSGPASRERVHLMRARSDAILVGAGTVLADNPSLTARLGDRALGRSARQPLRIVLDSRGRLPLDSRVFSPDLPGRTIVACAHISDDRIAALADRNVEVVQVQGTDRRVDLGALMDHLAERGIVSVLAEGGSEVLASLYAAGMVQRTCAFIAPKIAGGCDALGPVGGVGCTRMAEARRLGETSVEVIEGDVLITSEDPWNDEPEAAARVRSTRTRLDDLPNSGATTAGPVSDGLHSIGDHGRTDRTVRREEAVP